MDIGLISTERLVEDAAWKIAFCEHERLGEKTECCTANSVVAVFMDGGVFIKVVATTTMKDSDICFVSIYLVDTTVDELGKEVIGYSLQRLCTGSKEVPMEVVGVRDEGKVVALNLDGKELAVDTFIKHRLLGNVSKIINTNDVVEDACVA